MKKIFLALLCLILVFSMVSCKDPAEKDDPKTEASQTTTALTKEDDPSGEDSPAFKRDPYEDIIEKYEELLRLKVENKALPKPHAMDADAIKAVYKVVETCKKPADMGYAKKDINNDGVEELILMRSSFDIAAIFTAKSGGAIPLIAPQSDIESMIWIDEDGFIREEQSVRNDGILTARRYFVYRIVKGELTPDVAISCNGRKNGDWQKIDGEGGVDISSNEWHTLYDQYDICPGGWDMREYTKNHAELSMVRLFDAPAPKVQTYMLSSIIKDDEFRIEKVSKGEFSFFMSLSQYKNDNFVSRFGISLTATLVDGQYVFQGMDGKMRGSIEFGQNCVWVNIDESKDMTLDRSSYLFDYIK